MKFMSEKGERYMKPKKSEETAYQYIKGKIVTQEWLPDAHIREQDVANALEISRTPVRKAFLRLEEEGFVVKEPHRGIRVRRPDLSQKAFQDLTEFLELMINHYLHKLQVEEKALEMDELKESLERMEQEAQGRHEHFLEGEFNYWDALLQEEKNTYSKSMIVGTIRFVNTQKGYIEKILSESREDKVAHLKKLTDYIEEQNYPYARREIRILLNQLVLNVIQGA